MGIFSTTLHRYIGLDGKGVEYQRLYGLQICIQGVYGLLGLLSLLMISCSSVFLANLLYPSGMVLLVKLTHVKPKKTMMLKKKIWKTKISRKKMPITLRPRPTTRKRSRKLWRKNLLPKIKAKILLEHLFYILSMYIPICIAFHTSSVILTCFM